MGGAGGTSSTLPDCAEFQGFRALGGLAVLFGYVGALIVLSEMFLGDNNKRNMWATAFLSLTWVCGLISWALWYCCTRRRAADPSCVCHAQDRLGAEPQ